MRGGERDQFVQTRWTAVTGEGKRGKKVDKKRVTLGNYGGGRTFRKNVKGKELCGCEKGDLGIYNQEQGLIE